MKLTQDVRDMAALEAGMAEKAEEFRAGGSELYLPSNRVPTGDLEGAAE
jgi:hypothetical protein